MVSLKCLWSRVNSRNAFSSPTYAFCLRFMLGMYQAQVGFKRAPFCLVPCFHINTFAWEKTNTHLMGVSKVTAVAWLPHLDFHGMTQKRKFLPLQKIHLNQQQPIKSNVESLLPNNTLIQFPSSLHLEIGCNNQALHVNPSRPIWGQGGVVPSFSPRHGPQPHGTQRRLLWCYSITQTGRA